MVVMLLMMAMAMVVPLVMRMMSVVVMMVIKNGIEAVITMLLIWMLGVGDADDDDFLTVPPTCLLRSCCVLTNVQYLLKSRSPWVYSETMSADPMEEQRARQGCYLRCCMSQDLRRSLSHASAQPPILSTSLTSQEVKSLVPPGCSAADGMTCKGREAGEQSSRSNSLMLMRDSSGSHMKNIGNSGSLLGDLLTLAAGLKSLEDFDVAQRGLGQYAAETESLLSDHDIMGGSSCSGRSSARISATGEVALSSFGQPSFWADCKNTPRRANFVRGRERIPSMGFMIWAMRP
eukprot:756335-Hanusia_phi.AAC.2